jgi:hypothetical protein
MQQQERLEVVGHADHMAGDQPWAADGYKLLIEERIADQVGPAPMPVPDADIEMQIGIVRPRPGVGLDLELEFRIALLEAREARHEKAHREGRQHADAQRAAIRVRIESRQRRRLQLVEQGLQPCRIGRPILRQHDLLVLVLEQPGVEIFLELRDLAADGPMGNRQLLRRARQVLVARGCLKRTQRIQRRKLTARHGAA